MTLRLGRHTQLAALILPLVVCLLNNSAVGQSAGDYRSVVSGDWGSASTWELYNGASWSPAAVGPTSTNGVITIRSGHIVTVAADVTVDQVVIDAGGQVTTNNVLTVIDGSGTDLDVSGSLVLNDHVILTSTSTAVFKDGAQVTVNSGEFNPEDNSSVTFQSGSTATINVGKIKLEHSSLLTIGAGATLENWDVVDIGDTATFQLDGDYINRKTTTLGGTASVVVGGSGVYEHAQDGGNVMKVGFVTWETGSTCLVTGVTGARPGELDHTFSDFVWSSAGQTKDLNLDRNLGTVSDTLTIADTGTFFLSWEQDHDDDLTLGGDYVQTGGTFVYTDGNGIGTMTVPGDLTISGGTLLLTSQDGAPTLTVAGDFDLSGGTISETGIGSALIKLDGTSNQQITGTGIISNDIDFELDNAAGATLASSLSLPRDVTVTAGTLDLSSNDLSVAGNLSVSGDLTNPALLTFDGTANQSFSYAPGTFLLPELRVDNTGGDLVLGTDLTVTTSIILANGDLDLSGQALLLEAGSVLYESGGSALGTLTMERDYALDADGWRMLASPLSGVNFSSLNTSFHTQGGRWANVVEAESNLRTLDFAAQDWDEYTGDDAPFTEGLGYIFFMFADDADGGDVLPATWSVTGTTQTGIAQTLSFNTDPTDSWSLVGNPLTANLDWDAVVSASTSLGNTYATWDPALTPGGGMLGYKYYNSASGVGDAGRYIPPFQAFMAQATTAGASISFESSEAANAVTANYFGKRQGRSISPYIRLNLDGERLAEHETYVVFDDRATAGSDPFDVDRLTPLSSSFATLWFASAESRRLAFDSRSMADGYEEYGLCVAATDNGWYTLSWPEWHNIPAGWRIKLSDRDTGEVVDLTQRSSYRLQVTDVVDADDPFGMDCSQPESARLLLQVTDPAMAGPGFETPVSANGVRLVQNYPNPFRSSTTVRFGIEESGHVQLYVFDLTGRRVATLVDTHTGAGWHDILWNAAGLPSGTYICRLLAANAVKTIPVVLIQ